MSINGRNTRPITNNPALPSSIFHEEVSRASYNYPSARELHRLLERRRATVLGYEVPLNLYEAAEYVGLCAMLVAGMAIKGVIPSSPVAEAYGTRIFFASELDAWINSLLSREANSCRVQ